MADVTNQKSILAKMLADVEEMDGTDEKKDLEDYIPKYLVQKMREVLAKVPIEITLLDIAIEAGKGDAKAIKAKIATMKKDITDVRKRMKLAIEEMESFE